MGMDVTHRVCHSKTVESFWEHCINLLVLVDVGVVVLCTTVVFRYGQFWFLLWHASCFVVGFVPLWSDSLLDCISVA